jgi:ribonuclease HI
MEHSNTIILTTTATTTTTDRDGDFHMEDLGSNTIRVWTDGSSKKGDANSGGGVTAIIPSSLIGTDKDQVVFAALKFPGVTDNNIAEAETICWVLKWLRNSFRGCDALIYTDSDCFVKTALRVRDGNATCTCEVPLQELYNKWGEDHFAQCRDWENRRDNRGKCMYCNGPVQLSRIAQVVQQQVGFALEVASELTSKVTVTWISCNHSGSFGNGTSDMLAEHGRKMDQLEDVRIM